MSLSGAILGSPGIRQYILVVIFSNITLLSQPIFVMFASFLMSQSETVTWDLPSKQCLSTIKYNTMYC